MCLLGYFSMNGLEIDLKCHESACLLLFFFFLIHYGFYCGSAWFYAATLKFFVSVYWIFDDVLVNTNESTLCFIWIHLEAIYVTVTVFFINSSTVIAKMIEDNKAPCGTPKDTVFIFSLILSDCFLLLR